MKKSITPVQRRWATVFATLGIAFLSGHLMQADRDAPATIEQTEASIALPEAQVVMSSLSPLPNLRDRILETRSERKGNCEPQLELHETPAGLLQVSLDAPCHARTPLTLRFNQLIATDVTDARGRWGQRLPALSPDATISLSIGDETVAGRLQHELAGDEQHVILAWTGTQTFRIHVDDHLDAGSAPHAGEAGRLFRVGNGSGAAFEIMSFASGTDGSSAVVRLSVDADITRENCGRTATTLAYQTGYLGTLRPTEIAYTMPDCDRVGEVVRLQNLFRDLRLAGR